MDPNLIPALKPPPGVVPNFIDPPTRGPQLIAAVVVMVVIAALASGARLFTRAYVMRDVTLDDYSLVLAMIFFVLAEYFNLAQTPYSTGRHQWDVNLVQIELYLWNLNYSTIFYALSMFFSKLAIILQLKRIFRGAQRDIVWWLCVGAIAVHIIYYFVSLMLLILQCVPREKIWNAELPGTCVGLDANMLANGALNIALDFFLLCLPIFAIFRLKITIEKKLRIYAIFATGLLASLSSILRLIYSIILVRTADATYATVDLAWTACLECCSAILVASFPVMPRLYQFIIGARPANIPCSRSASAGYYNPRGHGVGNIYGSERGAERGGKGSLGGTVPKRGSVVGNAIGRLSGGFGCGRGVEREEEDMGMPRGQWVQLKDGEGRNGEGDIRKTVNIETVYEERDVMSGSRERL